MRAIVMQLLPMVRALRELELFFAAFVVTDEF